MKQPGHFTVPHRIAAYIRVPNYFNLLYSWGMIHPRFTTLATRQLGVN